MGLKLGSKVKDSPIQQPYIWQTTVVRSKHYVILWNMLCLIPVYGSISKSSYSALIMKYVLAFFIGCCSLQTASPFLS